MTTQVFVASTAFGLATLVAALDDGAFEPADHRVLVLSINAAVPETATAIEEVAGVGGLLEHFDAVHDYNAAIAPQHPSQWQPRPADLPLVERYLTQRWGLQGDLHLVVECVWALPGLALCCIFPDARIDTYADGLMSYGPTRSAVPTLVGSRIERLLHLDLVPGLEPVLLTEHDVVGRVISTDAFRKVLATMGTPPAVITDAAPGSVAVLLGQYLGALDILTADEEEALHLDMVRGAVAAGFRSLVFKPHPGAPPLLTQPLREAAEALGAELTVLDEPALAETWFRAPAAGAVISCFSTALMTAATCYQLPAAHVGTELVMARLRPFENSNRIPLTLVDACLPEVHQLAQPTRRPAEHEIGPLVAAVSYCMQARRYPQLRPAAEALLASQDPGVLRYFHRRRLGKLELPGGIRRAGAPGTSSGRAPSTAVRRLRRRVGRLRRRWRDVLSAG